MAPLSFRATQSTDAIQTRAAAPTPSFHCRNFHLEKPRKRKNGGNSKMGLPVHRPTPAPDRADNKQSNDSARFVWGDCLKSFRHHGRQGVISRLDHFVIQPELRRAVCHRHPVPDGAAWRGGPMFLSIIHRSERSKSRIASNGENCPRSAAPSPEPAPSGSSGKSCHVHRPMPPSQ